MEESGSHKRALAGLRVLDLSQYIAGPYCTKLMADYGAEVIKVERPGSGDGARRLGPFPGDIPHPEKSGLFLYLNTNKESITLNLKTSSGASILKELVAQADILVESFRPGRMEGWGLGYGVLSGINPRLVMCSVSNFGQTGPYRDYSATELVLQAMSGFMSGCGEPEREPIWVPLYLAQQVAGIYAFITSLAAENYSHVTGKGLYADISILEAMLELQELMIMAYFYSGEIRERLGHRRKTNHPTNILRCKDGYIQLAVVTVREWKDLARLVGRPELGDDPRFSTGPDRAKYADELDALFIPWLAESCTEEVYRTGQGRRIPFSMVLTADGVMKSKQLEARGFFREIDHPVAGKFTYPGPPFPMTETPVGPIKPAPLLGQHNEEVYCQRLGYCRADLATLAAARVI